MKTIKDESGSVAVFVALLLTVILIFTALVLDIGAAYIKASAAQNAADAIALSVGSLLPVDSSDSSAQAEIISIAKDYASKNGIENFNNENITLGDLIDGKYTSVSINVNKVSVTSFAKIIGIDNLKIKKEATVSLVPVGSIKGAVPIGMEETAFDTAKSSSSMQHVILKVGGGDGDTGFYGFIVLDGSNGNAVVLENCLKYGYSGTNSIGEILPVATGNKASAVKNGVEYRLSACSHYLGQGGCTPLHYDEKCPKIVFVLIYRFIESRSVEVVGFAPFLLEAAINFDEIQGSFLDINISYAEKTSQKNCGTYTFRLTK